MPITVQDTYLTDYAQGFPGMLADGNTQSRPTGQVADAAGIQFGRATFGTGTGKQITATPGGKFKGITIADVGIVGGLSGAVDTYHQNASASLLDMGNIWVAVTGAVTKDAAVYVTAAGAFTATSTGNTAIPATFLDAATDTVARIRVVQQ